MDLSGVSNRLVTINQNNPVNVAFANQTQNKGKNMINKELADHGSYRALVNCGNDAKQFIEKYPIEKYKSVVRGAFEGMVEGVTGGFMLSLASVSWIIVTEGVEKVSCRKSESCKGGYFDAAMILVVLGIFYSVIFGSLNAASYSWTTAAFNPMAKKAASMKDILDKSFKLISVNAQRSERALLEQNFIDHAKKEEYVHHWSIDGGYNVNRPKFQDFEEFQVGLSGRVTTIFTIAMATISDRKRSTLATCNELDVAIGMTNDPELVFLAKLHLGHCYEDLGRLQPTGQDRNDYILKALDQYVNINSNSQNEDLRKDAEESYHKLFDCYPVQIKERRTPNLRLDQIVRSNLMKASDNRIKSEQELLELSNDILSGIEELKPEALERTIQAQSNILDQLSSTLADKDKQIQEKDLKISHLKNDLGEMTFTKLEELRESKFIESTEIHENDQPQMLSKNWT